MKQIAKQITNSNQVKCSLRKLKNAGVYGDILASVRSILVTTVDPYLIIDILNNKLLETRLTSFLGFLTCNDTNRTRSNVISQTIL